VVVAWVGHVSIPLRYVLRFGGAFAGPEMLESGSPVGVLDQAPYDRSEDHHRRAEDAHPHGGSFSRPRPVRVSTIAIPRRRIDCEVYAASRAPTNVPGLPPMISGSRISQSMPLTIMCEIAADRTSGIACTRSVPTSLRAESVG
jgi:hypothetical protein